MSKHPPAQNTNTHIKTYTPQPSTPIKHAGSDYLEEDDDWDEEKGRRRGWKEDGRGRREREEEIEEERKRESIVYNIIYT